MRRIALVLMIAGVFPLSAQEVGLHVSSAIPRHVTDALLHGVGASLGGSFRLGDILADSSLARRAGLRIGGRVSVTEMSYEPEFNCADDCPPPPSGTLRSWLFTAFMLPHASRTARIELNGGVGVYEYRAGSPGTDWGFVGGAGAMRRFGSSPLWFSLAYLRHGDDFAEMADGGDGSPPVHSARAGLIYRFADRRGR
jgi:hypothetical protein